MALRKRGKGFYHAYFVRWERSGTSLRKRQVEVCLYTHDRDVARKLENDLMQKSRTASLEARAGAKIETLLNGTDVQRVMKAKRRLKVSDALERASRYAAVGESAQKVWRRFVRESGFTYMDEITPEDALAYLEKRYSGEKVYNNARCALNGIFKLLLVDAGLAESPFDRIHARRVHSACQRPFTREEYERIRAAAPSPWKEAVQIAWHTGMREKDVFTLRWSEITGDRIQKTPAKTARFKRAVVIFIHPHLQAVLDGLPREGERVLGAWPYKPNDARFRSVFGQILKQAGISTDETGIVNFNSFRNSFISRCDAAGIPRHAVRGTVGHVSDEITDLYSHDETSARLIQTLPD